MYWDATFVKPLADYRIYVEIKDGRRGIFDMKPYLDKGVFQELRNEAYFKQVGILFGAVTWPNEQDIAPDTLVSEMLIIDSSDQSALQETLHLLSIPHMRESIMDSRAEPLAEGKTQLDW
jgi:Protein of unknown function (DUF2442)